MSANDTSKQDVVISSEAKAAWGTRSRAALVKLAVSVEEAGTKYMLSCMAFGREAVKVKALLVSKGASDEAAEKEIVDHLTTARKRPYVWSTIKSYGAGAAGYDSLTESTRKHFKSLDIFVKLGSLPEEAEGEISREGFAKQLIAAGVTAEKGVREAVSAERKRRNGTPDNEITRVRKQTEKVAKLAGKDVTRLSKQLPTGNHAKLFLIGARYAAGLITANPGMDVKAYRDGMDEAFHPLTLQPNTVTEEKPKAKPKAAPKVAAK